MNDGFGIDYILCMMIMALGAIMWVSLVLCLRYRKIVRIVGISSVVTGGLIRSYMFIPNHFERAGLLLILCGIIITVMSLVGKGFNKPLRTFALCIIAFGLLSMYGCYSSQKHKHDNLPG